MRQASAIRRTDNKSNIVGERLRLARHLHDPVMTMDATCRRIAENSGYRLTKTIIIRIENGARSVYDYEVVALAQALEVDVRFLLGLIDDPQPT